MKRSRGIAKQRNFNLNIEQYTNYQIKSIKFAENPNPLHVKDLLLFYLIRYMFDFKKKMNKGESSMVNTKVFNEEMDFVMQAIEDLRQGKEVKITWK